MALQKYDIVNGLGRARRLSRYLEICTPTTGVKYSFVDPATFAIRDRLMYRCPETFDDGMEIAFRTAAEGSHDLVRAIQHLQPGDGRYDLIFVDPWHSYAASLNDLHGALSLLRPGGVIVVHDCNPTDPATVGAEFRAGAWCGLTYQAFIDFVLAAQPEGYCTADADHGCGVVFTRGAQTPPGLATTRPGRRLVFEWTLAREDDAARWACFDRQREALLNLVSPAGFAEAAGVPMWTARTHKTVNLLANPCWGAGADHWGIGSGVTLAPVEDGVGVLLDVVPPGASADVAWSAPEGSIHGRFYDAAHVVAAGQIVEAQIAVMPGRGLPQMLLLFVDEAGGIVGSPITEARDGGARWQTMVIRSEAPPGALYATVLLRLLNDGAEPAALSMTATRALLALTVKDADENLIWAPPP